MGSKPPGFRPQFKYKAMGDRGNLGTLSLMLGPNVENGIQDSALLLILYCALETGLELPLHLGTGWFSEPRELATISDYPQMRQTLYAGMTGVAQPAVSPGPFSFS